MGMSTLKNFPQGFGLILRQPRSSKFGKNEEIKMTLYLAGRSLKKMNLAEK
jgi:hypothetical protein